MKYKINWKVLIWCFVIVYAVAAIGSIFTSRAVKSSWYQAVKPSITPPNWVFPIVWTTLFFLIALSLYLSWIYSTKKEKDKIILAYGFNFVFNIAWSILYFGLKNPLTAFFNLILLWASILYMMMLTWRIDKKAAYLLIPYLLWVSFAGILNYLSI